MRVQRPSATIANSRNALSSTPVRRRGFLDRPLTLKETAALLGPVRLNRWYLSLYGEPFALTAEAALLGEEQA